MATMRDVLRFFEKITGEEFYPNSVIVGRSSLINGIISAFDCVIGKQAEALGCNHGAAISPAYHHDELAESATQEFAMLCQLIGMVSEVITAEKNAGWPNTGTRSLVFASGTKDGGGSGAEKLVEATRATPKVLHTHIVAFVSNHERGGAYERAKRLGVPFVYYSPKAHGNDLYRRLYELLGVDYCLLSGWVLKTEKLPVSRTVNIHPGLIPAFGGKGMHGDHVHEAVIAAYHRGEVTHSGVTMHFVDGEYDHGPKFFELFILIEPGDTAETLQKRVNAAEHRWQAAVTNLVVTGQIRLTAMGNVIVPDPYREREYCPETLRQTAVA